MFFATILLMAFVRKFKTASGATGVQVCWKEHSEVVRTEHIGSATTEEELRKLMVDAQKVIDRGKQSLFDLDSFNDEDVKFDLIEGAPAGKRRKK